MSGTLTWLTVLVLSWTLLSDSGTNKCSGFAFPPSTSKSSATELHRWANRLSDVFDGSDAILADATRPINPELEQPSEQLARRPLLVGAVSTALTALLSPLAASADFAPGGTLLDREVGILVGNPEASPSRARDNSNVIFNQDNYFKFGAAAPWIPPGSTDFPKTMPFVPKQQRYDALKKYGARVAAATDIVGKIRSADSPSDVPEQTDPAYQLRALGLLANSFFASENTGTTNELMLARWYVNEIYLRIGDYRGALEKGDVEEAKACFTYMNKALNSYLSLLNRSITSKVGDEFSYST